MLSSEREPLDPVVRRRLRAGGAVVVASCVVLAAGSVVRERRADEARRLAGTWQLSADGPAGFGLEAGSARSLSAVMDLTLSLRNDAGRAVVVTGASAGGFVLGAPVPLPARTTRDVVLHQELDCTADTLLPPGPPSDRPTAEPLRWPGPLQVVASTPRGTATVTFDRPPYDSSRAAAACDGLRRRR